MQKLLHVIQELLYKTIGNQSHQRLSRRKSYQQTTQITSNEDPKQRRCDYCPRTSDRKSQYYCLTCNKVYVCAMQYLYVVNAMNFFSRL